MRSLALVAILACSLFSGAQHFDSIVARSKSMIADLRTGDSLTYYQCHVEEVGIQITTGSGQTINTNSHKCSITEKFVLIKTPASYLVRYYTSSVTELPNRKFSNLKVREKAYWNFKKEKELSLEEWRMAVLLALERKGREAIEYDFVISKNNTNQLILRRGRDFKQLVIDGDYVLSRIWRL